MDLELIRQNCLSKPFTDESFPFDEDTLVFKVQGKIFAIVPLERMPLQINLKCDPDRAVELRDEYPDSIFPGYHMNKKHWNTIILESGLSDRICIDLVDHSYMLVVNKLKKDLKTQVLNQL